MDMTVEVPELPELTFDEASHIYRLNGDIIPSVSKLMEPLKDQCYGGISKRTLENAAIKGSAVHNSIENWIKFGIDDIPSEHRGYFNGFMEWWKQYKPRVFGSEVRIYHKLKALLDKRGVDPQIYDLLCVYINTTDGLPLGYQTSQLLALMFLDEFDHLMKEKYRLKYYGRYMDDFYVILSDKQRLKDMFRYELRNHEYTYTCEVEGTVEACGFTMEQIENDERLRHGLEAAAKKLREAAGFSF